MWIVALLCGFVTGYAIGINTNKERGPEKNLPGEAEELRKLQSTSRATEESLRNEVRQLLNELSKVRRDLSELETMQSRAERAKNVTLADTTNLERRLKEAESALTEYVAQNEFLREGIENVTNQLVNESLKYICDSVTPNNFEASKRRMERVFQLCRKSRLQFQTSDQEAFLAKISEIHEREVKRQAAREEQARIKEKIRQEQREERVRQEELRRLERDEELITEALAKALRETQDKHSEEIKLLEQQLADAHAKNERAKSMAQLTKAGYVYVISNVGSFGEDVFKVGMTRRLEPMERVKELGDASVPFPFDVHMMISSEDAPSLEVGLHSQLNQCRVNKVNLRKEFFKVELSKISSAVERLHGKVEYRATADAFEYRETVIIEERGGDVAFDPAQEVDDEATAA